MESIRENRPLMISLVGTYSFIVFLALGWSSDLCEQFGIVQFPEEVFIYNVWNQDIAMNYKNLLHCDEILNIIQNIFSSFQFRSILLQVLMLDFMMSLLIDRILSFLFGEGKLRQPRWLWGYSIYLNIPFVLINIKHFDEIKWWIF